jgi:hypothetical protein
MARKRYKPEEIVARLQLQWPQACVTVKNALSAATTSRGTSRSRRQFAASWTASGLSQTGNHTPTEYHSFAIDRDLIFAAQLIPPILMAKSAYRSGDGRLVGW